jgi:uncharacterized protein YneF (UPF0154 family)
MKVLNIVWIVIACLGFCFIIGLLIYIMRKKKSKNARKQRAKLDEEGITRTSDYF